MQFRQVTYVYEGTTYQPYLVAMWHINNNHINLINHVNLINCIAMEPINK